MSHVHQQIRDAVKTALTGLATTGARVYANRVYPLSDADLPGIRLFVLSEQVDQDLSEYAQRELILSIEACAKASTTLDDTLDQIGAEIETALAGVLTVGGKALRCTYAGMETDFEPLDTPVGLKRHHYRVIFYTAASAPDAFA